MKEEEDDNEIVHHSGVLALTPNDIEKIIQAMPSDSVDMVVMYSCALVAYVATRVGMPLDQVFGIIKTVHQGFSLTPELQPGPDEPKVSNLSVHKMYANGQEVSAEGEADELSEDDFDGGRIQ